MSDHDDRDPGDEFWSNEEDNGDNSDYDSFNEEDKEIVDLYDLVGLLNYQDEDELNSADSLFRSVGCFLFSGRFICQISGMIT